MVKCGQHIKLKNSAILVVLNVTVRIETLHSIPLLSPCDLSQVSFTFSDMYLLYGYSPSGFWTNIFMYIFVSPHLLHYSPPPPPNPPDLIILRKAMIKLLTMLVALSLYMIFVLEARYISKHGVLEHCQPVLGSCLLSVMLY